MRASKRTKIIVGNVVGAIAMIAILWWGVVAPKKEQLQAANALYRDAFVLQVDVAHFLSSDSHRPGASDLDTQLQPHDKKVLHAMERTANVLGISIPKIDYAPDTVKDALVESNFLLTGHAKAQLLGIDAAGADWRKRFKYAAHQIIHFW